MKLALFILGLLLNLGICGLVLINNPKSRLNRLAAVSALTLAFWEVSNFLADTSGPLTLWWNRITFIIPMLIVLSGDLFILFLSGRTIKQNINIYKALFIGSVILGVVALTGLIVPSISPRLDSGHLVGYNPNYGSAYPIIFAWLFVLIGHLIKNIYSAWKKAKGLLRLQLNIIFAGLSAALLAAVLSNLILPNIIGNSASSQYAPLASVLYMGAIAFAILKHHLFDIRLIVARSLAYLLSLTVLGGVFVLITFGVTNYLFNNHILKGAELQVIYAIIAVILAPVFPAIKRYFDKVTNKFFYRDAYDPQVFLDVLNKTILDNIELGILLRHTATVIEENLKCEYATFVIYDEANKSPRFIGAKGTANKFSNILAIRDSLGKRNQRVIVYEGLNNEAESYKRILRDDRISVIATLQPPGESAANARAYLILGDKKSGNVYSNSDIGIIEIISNELTIAIQNALRFEEIQNFNATLQQRINEATRKLRRANEKLESLDEAKDDFISMASHQLRTPLTSVKGYISMVLEGDAGAISPPQRKLLSQAFSSSQRMVYIIADLLNVSRLRTGKFEMESSPVNLSEVVEQELAQLKDAAEARNLKLLYKKPENFPALMLDDTKTRQVIMNFVDNAIYYTPSGGQIEVKLIDRPATVELRIEDDGIGVPKSEQPHLFTKFYRAANARKARPDGTGLGLFMAKKIIIAQNGALIFESHEGKGSTFGFTLNKSKLAVPAAT